MNHPDLLEQYDRSRNRLRMLFETISDETYFSRPIPLRNPIVFYQGHVSAFSFNTLIRKGLGRPSINARLEQLFERGIDPHESSNHVTARGNDADLWPSRSEVKEFCDEADSQVRDAVAEAEGDLHRHLETMHCILEHETMHHETLMYLWHQIPLEFKQRPADYVPKVGGPQPQQMLIDVPGGTTTLGVAPGALPFAWDNEMPANSEVVPAFRIQQHNVTNAEYLEFVDAGGYDDPKWWSPSDWSWIQENDVRHPHFWKRDAAQWLWRGMFDQCPLPLTWPVWVSHAEASAYARWHNMALPTEAQYQRAAYASPDEQPRQYPWGNALPDATHGVFDFDSWDPQPSGSHPSGRSVWGVDDLVGNGWEWTATVFAPFPGFKAMPSYPEYSADFFDGEHFVMKGASPMTARELIRPSLRNWFRARYPYVFASFRCVTGATS